jgi:hypothetical protein
MRLGLFCLILAAFPIACAPGASAVTIQQAVSCVPPSTARFVTSVDAGGRFFRDQRGDPILIRGDSPWAGLTRWSPDQARLWFDDRERTGFNAAIISLIGAVANGAPSDDGATYDGVQPFVDGDVTRWNEPYWQRVDDVMRLACAHGVTVFLYPIDGWTMTSQFRSAGEEKVRAFTAMVAQRYGGLPNVVWTAGGDYFAVGRFENQLFAAMLDTLRAYGSTRPFSIQLGYPVSRSTDSPFWRDLVDWDFVYSYQPVYRAVLDAYHRTPPRPSLLSETNYEGEHNIPGSPVTTSETLRRQVLWALTSGSPGTFFGSADWQFLPGWEARLDTPAVRQLQAVRDWFAARPWSTLVPDEGDELVTSGRGTELTRDDPNSSMLGDDWATAARTPDGSWWVVYVPTARTLTLRPGVSAVWVDPADAAGPTRPAIIDDGGQTTTPGPNVDDGPDWLLSITRG